MSKIVPVVLCGGSGTRLWPLSRESFPKQFVPLIKGDSLLDLTLKRVKAFGTVRFVANEEHRFFIKELINKYGYISEAKILLEPQGRNTAAAMAIAAFSDDINDSDLMLFLPSDHYVPDIDLFLATVESGIAAANDGYIVTFGVQPNFPATGYGYIQHGKQLEPNLFQAQSRHGFYVERFVEKPNLEKAQEMLLSGNFFWNSGIFLCQASTLRIALEKHAPDILRSCQFAMKQSVSDGNFIRPEREQFLNCRAESIDYAVMEHFNRVAVFPFKGIWCDVGSWNAVANLTPSDDSGNRINGHGISVQSSNTYINAPHRAVVALGTNDLIIVDTVDAVLVASVDKVEQVKNVVANLKKNGLSQAVSHHRVYRPWGWYESLDHGNRFQVKHISVRPGSSLSLQLHHHRAEHWIVVKGTARVTNGDSVFLLEENQSTFIPLGTKHRLENAGHTDLEMIEVQSGDYLGEDDIVRFEDNYGRC